MESMPPIMPHFHKMRNCNTYVSTYLDDCWSITKNKTFSGWLPFVYPISPFGFEGFGTCWIPITYNNFSLFSFVLVGPSLTIIWGITLFESVFIDFETGLYSRQASINDFMVYMGGRSNISLSKCKGKKFKILRRSLCMIPSLLISLNPTLHKSFPTYICTSMN